jgi:hypothetical protein
MNIELLILQLKPYFTIVRFTKPLFNNYPKKITGLKFGFICPGAMKTINFLQKNITNNKNKLILEKIKLYTDTLFFIEIIELYRNYIDKELIIQVKKIIKNNSCAISNILTQNISKLLAQLPKYISKNIPDDFYHIRHNTLICSKDKTLAKQRIQLLQSIYK